MPTPIPRPKPWPERRLSFVRQQQPARHRPDQRRQQQFGATDYQPASPVPGPAPRRAPDIADISGDPSAPSVPSAPSEAPMGSPPNAPAGDPGAIRDYARDADVQIDARAAVRRQLH